MTDSRMICRFATAYAAMIQASAEGNENSRIVWLDIYVAAADALGIDDHDHHGLKDARAEARSRHEEFLANYYASRVDEGATSH